MRISVLSVLRGVRRGMNVLVAAVVGMAALLVVAELLRLRRGPCEGRKVDPVDDVCGGAGDDRWRALAGDVPKDR